MTDAVVVGAGPNGLAAAVVLARAGLSVEIFERASQAGGGARTMELTVPGYVHDLGAAVHPLAMSSPFFREFDLASRVELLTPEISYAHPRDLGGPLIAYKSLERTVDSLGRDGRSWRRLMEPLVRRARDVTALATTALLTWPTSLSAAFVLGMRVAEQGTSLWNSRLGADAATLLTGVSAHAVGRQPRIPPAAVGLTLAMHGHVDGWPIPRGGSQAIVDAMCTDIRLHGGIIHLGREVADLRELPPHRAAILDVSPRAAANMAGASFPPRYARSLRRFRYGDGVAKVDFALSAPVPWRDTEMAGAVTAHLGGTRAEIAASERDVANGRHPDRPYVLFSQPTVLDPSRAPSNRHVGWAYTHVPAGSTVDPAEAVTSQIERWAPGFRDTIVASASMSAAQIEVTNPNFIGGDISSGALTLAQLVKRPTWSSAPWRTPAAGIYLGSSSTPPATGVHGMSGYHAACAALEDVFRLPLPDLGAVSE